jgi:hypothetical protein
LTIIARTRNSLCRKFILGLILFAFLFLASCIPNQAKTRPDLEWAYTDLRALNPTRTSNPSQDLVAAYTRQGKDLQFRFDFLDHTELPEYDLYLALDTVMGGTTALPLNSSAGIAWDTLLVIPATGNLQILTASSFISPTSTDQPLQGDENQLVTSSRASSALRVIRNPGQDTIEVSLDPASLSDGLLGGVRLGFTFQVFVTPAGSRQKVSSLGPVRSDASTPHPATILFAFWDTFPAYTPALALRRWDGAHTGPLGGRHGLFNLLHAAQNTQTPLVLLDLRNPASLSSLDFVGGISIVQDMVADGLLNLPRTSSFFPASLFPYPASESLTNRLLFDQRQITQAFGLLDQPSSLINRPNPREGFTPTKDLYVDTHFTFLTDSDQATASGPSFTLRQALIENAFSSRPFPYSILVLGGDLPTSTWGEPQYARSTFQYMKRHPWIKILNANYLIPAEQPSISPWTKVEENLFLSWKTVDLYPLSLWKNDGVKTNSNPIRLAAWQAYLSLFAPVYPNPSQLPTLRTLYLGQVYSLLEAAKWAEHPFSRTDCGSDPDQDGQFECILSSANFYAQFESSDGSLTFAFSIDPNGPHQLVGPSSQFITGLSEPSGWDLSRQLRADPQVIPGAFYDSNNFISKPPSVQPDQISFISQDGSHSKTFSLTSTGLRYDFQLLNNAQNSESTVQQSATFALDPWLRFTPGWSQHYQSETLLDGWVWQVNHGVRLAITTNAHLNAYSFLDTYSSLSATENPDIDYPPGHFLPFPLAQLDFTASGNFWVELQVK